jgi:hypothetical protein
MKERFLKVRIDAGLEERLKKAAGPRGMSAFVTRAIERELKATVPPKEVAIKEPEEGVSPYANLGGHLLDSMITDDKGKPVKRPRPEDFDSPLKYSVAYNAWSKQP